MLECNQSCMLSSHVIIPTEARRLSLEVINPEMGYSSVNIIPGNIVCSLLECNKSCTLFECKKSPRLVRSLIICNTPQRFSEQKIS